MKRHRKYKNGPFEKDGTRKRAHVLIAEKALGKPLPEGAEVHHHDNDGTNNANNNLVICEDVAYHRLLHFRQRVLMAGGDPEKDKVCSTCRLAKPKTHFGTDIRHRDGLCLHCRSCWNLYHRNRRAVRANSIARKRRTNVSRSS